MGAQRQDLHLPLTGFVVTTDWLIQHLQHPQLLVVDVRLRESYVDGHVPNALHIELEDLTETIGGIEGMLSSPATFAERVSMLGIDHDKTVVVYDDHWGMPAARVYWSLVRYGHQRTALLNGGWDRWQAENRVVSTAVVTAPPADFTVRLVDDYAADRAWVHNNLHNPDVVFVDTRTSAEFAQGHLPGAVSWDWMKGVPSHDRDTFRRAQEVLPELAELGITVDKEVVTYCRSGARSAHTFMLLRQIGFRRVRNYDGSWLEWSQLQHDADNQ